MNSVVLHVIYVSEKNFQSMYLQIFEIGQSRLVKESLKLCSRSIDNVWCSFLIQIYDVLIKMSLQSSKYWSYSHRKCLAPSFDWNRWNTEHLAFVWYIYVLDEWKYLLEQDGQRLWYHREGRAQTTHWKKLFHSLPAVRCRCSLTTLRALWILSSGSWDLSIISYRWTKHRSFEILEPIVCLRSPEKDAKVFLLHFTKGTS